jgi:hypothetical protein
MSCFSLVLGLDLLEQSPCHGALRSHHHLLELVRLDPEEQRDLEGSGLVRSSI